MRIALLTPGFSRNANHWAIPALQLLAERLAQQHDVTVLSLRYPEVGVYSWGGLTHYALGGGVQFGWRSLPIWTAAVRQLLRRHRQRPFDLLHAFWADEPGLTAVVAGAILRRPVLVSMGGGELVHLPDIGYGTQGSAPRRWLVRLALRRAGLVSVGSLYQRALCQQHGVPAHKLHLAPLGIDTSRFRPAPTPTWERPTVVQVASLGGVKNQALLLEVLARVQTAVPAVQLIVAGDGPGKARLQPQAEALGLGQSVVFTSGVAYGDVHQLYQQAHLYLQSSRHESQGVAVAEALACGLPVLGTPVGILPQVACLPPATDPATLAAQAVAVLTDRVAYEPRRAAARATAVAHFDSAHTTAQFEQLYQRLLRESRP